MMAELLFVYGSLKSGESGHGVLLKANARLIGEAETIQKFMLIELDDYLAAIPSSKGVTLKGELYEVEDISIIDDYEDVPYLYERVKVRVSCKGREFQAWMYIAKRA